jgi:hypothetical protein
LELNRFVLGEPVPANGESWFLARCWHLAARQGVCGAVSFSDPVPRRTATGDLVFPGHIGTIHQASNAEYLGRTTPRRVLLLPDGRVLSERALSEVRGEERGHATTTASLSTPAATLCFRRRRRGSRSRCRTARRRPRSRWTRPTALPNSAYGGAASAADHGSPVRDGETGFEPPLTHDSSTPRR